MDLLSDLIELALWCVVHLQACYVLAKLGYVSLKGCHDFDEFLRCSGEVPKAPRCAQLFPSILMRLHRPQIGRSALRDCLTPVLRLPRGAVHTKSIGGPIAAYNEGIKHGRLREDPAQRIALQRFDRLYQDLQQYEPVADAA